MKKTKSISSIFKAKILMISFLLLIFFPSKIISQNFDSPFRMEFPASADTYPYEIINLGKEGFILYYESELSSSQTAKWTFAHFDTLFVNKWKVKATTIRLLEPITQFVDKNYIAVFFNYQGKKKPKVSNQIVLVNLKNINIEVIDIPHSESKFPKSVLARDNFLYYSLVQKDKEFFYYYNLSSKQHKAVNVLSGEDFSSREIKMNNKNPYLLGVVSTSKRNNNIYKIDLDSLGEVKSSLKIDVPSTYFINNVQSHSVGEDSLLILGNYINSSEKSITAINLFSYDEINSGVYSVLIVNDIVEKLNFYNYVNMENIYRYMTDKNVSRIKKKVGDDSKDSYSLNLRLISQDIKMFDSTVILLNEAYYAEYRTEENFSYDYYGRPFPTNRTVFDGYRYTNALICGFDLSGKLIWDNNFALNSILTYNLKARTSFFKDSTDIIMGYNQNGDIVSTIIDGNKILQAPEYLKVETISSSDFVIGNEKSELIHWYDNYFLATGYQRIRNNKKRTRGVQNTFYIIKMSYDLH